MTSLPSVEWEGFVTAAAAAARAVACTREWAGGRKVCRVGESDLTTSWSGQKSRF